MKRLVLCLLAVSMALTASAQQKIHGRVTDIEGYPISGATVCVEGAEKGAVAQTDKEGYYQMPSIKSGNEHYVFSCPGYESKKIHLKAKGEAEINVSLNKIPQPEKTLYVVDGRISSKAEVDGLSPDLIAGMNIMKGIESAIIITTKQKETEVVEIGSKPFDGQLVGGVAAVSESGAIPFMLVNDDKNALLTTMVTVDKNSGVEISDYAGEKSIRILKGGEELALNDKEVLVVVCHADGTFRTGNPGILKEINPKVIRTISVLKDDRAREMLREYNLSQELPAGGVIWGALGQPEMKIYKAKPVN